MGRSYINVSVPQDVYQIYDSIPRGQRGWIISRLLRAWYQAGQKGLLPQIEEEPDHSDKKTRESFRRAFLK